MSRYRLYSYHLRQADITGASWYLKIWMCDTYAPILQECFPRIQFNFKKLDGACETTVNLSPGEWVGIRNILELFKGHWILKPNEHLRKHFKDDMDQCFALDFNYEIDKTNDEKVYTRTGRLEHDAKEQADESAIQQLTASLTHFCNNHPLYREGDAIAAVPPNPSKKFHLPCTLAERVAAKTGKINGALLVTKSQDTAKAQQLVLDEKIPAIAKALNVHQSVKGKKIILIDDLYQSGSTMWTVARALKSAGAARVYGLACVKSWRDSDNQ
jgi:hypothetical protein